VPTHAPDPTPAELDDQLNAVAHVLAAGLARLLATTATDCTAFLDTVPRFAAENRRVNQALVDPIGAVAVRKGRRRPQSRSLGCWPRSRGSCRSWGRRSATASRRTSRRPPSNPSRTTRATLRTPPGGSPCRAGCMPRGPEGDRPLGERPPSAGRRRGPPGPRAGAPVARKRAGSTHPAIGGERVSSQEPAASGSDQQNDPAGEPAGEHTASRPLGRDRPFWP
jgi:hypothetical protein